MLFSAYFSHYFSRACAKGEWPRMLTCLLATFAHNYGLQNSSRGRAASSVRLCPPPVQLTQTKCNTPAVAKTTTDKVLITFISSRKVSTKRGGGKQKLDEKGGAEGEAAVKVALLYLVAVACL